MGGRFSFKLDHCSGEGPVMTKTLKLINVKLMWKALA